MNSSLKKLREQLEFYFGDSNYSRDKFMIARAAENDGFISLSVLLTFKRLKELNPSPEDVKEALKDSKTIEVKEENGNLMLRKIETDEFKEYLNDKEVSKRVLYMKGFDLKSTLDTIKEHLEKFCSPKRITMRRNEAREFKGSCFVEFSSKEEAESALSLQIPTVDSEDEVKKVKTENYLEIMSKDDYLSSKKKRKEDKKDEKFSDRVKNSFIPKLYKIEMNKTYEIKDVKQAIPNCAFVDLPKKVVRMKFAEEFKEKEFSIEGEQIKLVKMEEDEAKEYLKRITIKKTGNKQ